MENFTEFITSVFLSILSNESKGQRNLQMNIKNSLPQDTLGRPSYMLVEDPR